jgi:hypothetical protein
MSHMNGFSHFYMSEVFLLYDMYWILCGTVTTFHFIIYLLCAVWCRVVNGALEYLSKDLGIAENTVLQGTIF